ncbi:hypothetical protein [Devosia submarina]|uniref:hypothetical protein n=1 Tax=Devosia submarina TaxID=1173082 RepID=UPI000D39EFEA|nr:hypothetical protein [Devosia submarina]
MTGRVKTALKVVDNSHTEAEAAFQEAAKQTAPMVERFSAHREKIGLAVKELESERYELISRRDLLRRQAEAFEAGFAAHIADVESTLKLYEGGLNSTALSD